MSSVEWWTLGKVGFAECPRVALGKEEESSLCREPLDGTRQRRRLCRVPPIWHSANHILKIKKNLCRVPHRGHSAKNINLANPTASPSSLSHSRSLAARRRRPRSLAADPAPAPTLAAGHAPPRPCARSPALPAPPVLTACLLCRRRPPTTLRPRSPRARAPPTTADDPAPTTSTPSRPFAVVHRPRRANRYKLIFTF